MGICTICREETDAGERAPDGQPMCPRCARLFRWFLDHFADVAFRVPKGSFITPRTTFLELAIESLDYVEWILEAQERFGVEIGDLDAERMQTVAEYLRYIRLHATKALSREDSGRDPLWDRELDG